MTPSDIEALLLANVDAVPTKILLAELCTCSHGRGSKDKCYLDGSRYCIDDDLQASRRTVLRPVAAPGC
jgi:hypothetical protein